MFKYLRAVLYILVVLGAFYISGLGSAIKTVLNEAFLSTSAPTMAPESLVQKQVDSLSPYFKVTNGFNNDTISYGDFNTSSLEKMKAGTPLVGVSLPDYDSLQQSLDKVVKKGSSGSETVDKNVKATQEVLQKIVPLQHEMNNYYDSREFQKDNYAQGNKMIQQYLPLEAEFTQVYGALDNSIKKYRTELCAKEIEEAKESGKPNAARVHETLRLLFEVDGLLTGDDKQNNVAIESKLEALSKLNSSLTSVDKGGLLEGYKNSVSLFIGETREYLTQNKNPKRLNNVKRYWSQVIWDYDLLKINQLDE